MRTYDPDAPDEGEAAGPFFFPPSVVAEFRRRVLPRLRPHIRPEDSDYAALGWLVRAAQSARRKPDAEAKRRDGRQEWRASNAFDRVRLTVDPAPRPEGDLPACVGVRL